MGIQTVSQSLDNEGRGSPYGFKNRIINGDMRIDQRNSGAAVTTSNTSSPWTTDRWRAYSSANTMATAVHTTEQQTTVVPPGFSHALKATVTYGGSSYERAYFQVIEGLNFGDLKWGTEYAKTVTVSFWVRSSITGTFAFSVRNYNGTMSYVSMQTINSVDTWEQKTIIIPGPTSGTWTVSNSWGLIYEVCLGHSVAISAGATTTATPNTWVATNAITTASQTNFVATTGTTFYLTGFQFEVGKQATSFDFRDYGRELELCQRYFVKLQLLALPAAYYTYRSHFFGRVFPVTMRTTPSVTVYSSQTNTINKISGYSSGTEYTVSDVSVWNGDTISYVTTSSAISNQEPQGGTFWCSAEL